MNNFLLVQILKNNIKYNSNIKWKIIIIYKNNLSYNR